MTTFDYIDDNEDMVILSLFVHVMIMFDEKKPSYNALYIKCTCISST